MSTSPSWFDQEKFSHLVKKVGKKPAPAAAQPTAMVRSALARSPEKETRRLMHAPQDPASDETFAPTVSKKASQPLAQPRIVTPSQVSPDTVIRAPLDPGSREGEAPLPVVRSVSPLARRTTPLPNLKPIFEYDKPAEGQPVSEPPMLDDPAAKESLEEEESTTTGTQGESEYSELTPADDLTGAWQAVSSLNEELAQARDERDEALQEADALRAQLQEAGGTPSTGAAGSGQDEVSMALKERDNARRDYAKLREQFETLKHSQGHSQPLPAMAGTGDELDVLRSELAKRDEELDALKMSSMGLEDVVESLKQELNAVQTQIAQSRDEASIAQRGLALSQRALQETRDALREASEASSQTKLNLENLKNECSTLVQQNMLLQAQHDQLARELRRPS